MAGVAHGVRFRLLSVPIGFDAEHPDIKSEARRWNGVASCDDASPAVTKQERRVALCPPFPVGVRGVLTQGSSFISVPASELVLLGTCHQCHCCQEVRYDAGHVHHHQYHWLEARR